VVGVARRSAQGFDSAELTLLEAIMASVGHALERERRAAQQAALAAAARTIHASLELDAVLGSLCSEVVSAFAADVAVVSVADATGGYAAIAAHGLPDGIVGVRRERGAGLSGRAMATGAPALTNAYGPQGQAALRGLRSGVAVPLRRADGVDGALEVAFRRDRTVDLADAELLGAFADLAGVACENADRLAAARRDAARDSLTGCLNHGALQSRLREEISRAERDGGPIALALIDLDDFKAINERLGHLAGDAALRSAGERLRGSVRLHDVVARLGGDEFALLLTATAQEAQKVVDRAVRTLGDAPMPSGGELRASAGIAQWRPGVPATALIDAADGALRAAKRAGTGVAVAEERAAGEGPRARARLDAATALRAKLARLHDAESIAAAAAAALHEELGFPRCLVAALRDGRAEALADAGDGAGAGAAAEEGAIGRCLHERRAVLVADGGAGPELAAPVYTGGRLWGAIGVRAPHRAAFAAEDAQLVQTVADHVGAALLEAARVLERR
jgi:diguanylate cyclase (GGDEF)-like protein